MIFAHTNPRSWLKAELETRQKKNPQFSDHAFARRLRVSQSYFSRLMRGERPMSTAVAHRIAQSLELKPEERTYLDLLVEHERCENLERKNELQLAIGERKRESLCYHTGYKSLERLQAWHYYYLVIASGLTRVHTDLPYFSNALRAAPSHVWRALKILLTLGLVELRDDGELRQRRSAFHVLPEIVKKRALAKISRQLASRDTSDGAQVLLVATNPERVRLVEERIRALTQDLRRELEDCSDKSHVYQLSIALGPLSLK